MFPRGLSSRACDPECCPLIGQVAVIAARIILVDHMHNMQSTFSSKSTAVQGLAKGFYPIFYLGQSPRAKLYKSVATRAIAQQIKIIVIMICPEIVVALPAAISLLRTLCMIDYEFY